MEEDKIIKRKRIIRLISKIITYTIISILMLIAAILLFFAITGKISEKSGKNPPFGLYTIISPSMTPAINVYDVVLVKDTDTDKLKVNDVITFYSENQFFGTTPITHRIVDIKEENNEKLFVVKGDANEKIDDENVKGENILGKVVLKIPKLGRIQYFLASKKGWLLAIIIPTILVIAYDVFKIIKLIMLRNKLAELAEQDDTVLPEINTSEEENKNE